MTLMEEVADLVLSHHRGSGAKSNLMSVENQRVGEEIGDSFELVVGGEDEMALF